MPNSPYAGSAMYLGWVYSGGTVEIHTNFRNFNWSHDLNYIDATAGADQYEVLLGSYGTGQDITATVVGQVGGSVILTAAGRNVAGTLIYGPEGNATGKLKYSIPATSKGASFSQAYNSVNEITLQWRQTSVETEGVF
jgi:hypothetical protein